MHVGDITLEQWTDLQPYCSLRKFKRGELIIKAGDEDSRLGYIISGMVKRSFIHESGKELVHYFATVGRFVGSYSSVLLNESSKVNITAVEDTEVVSLDFHDYQKLYEKDRCWDRFTRRATELLFIDRERREYQLLMLSAKERYLSFLEDFGAFAPRLTKQEIASYLGITPEAFSRLLKNLNN